MGNPAEETYCYPNNWIVKEGDTFCQHRNNTVLGHEDPTFAGNPGMIPVALPGNVRTSPDIWTRRAAISPLRSTRRPPHNFAHG